MSKQITHRTYTRWTDDELRRLAKLKREGLTTRQIAERTGHPMSSVWAKWAELRDRALHIKRESER